VDYQTEMKILVVAEHFHPYGGAELSLWRLCRTLTEKGHQIQVITSRRRGEPDYEKKDKIEIFRPFPTGNLTGRFIFAVKLYPYLKRWLRERSVDVVYNLGHFCGRKWFRLTGLPMALFNLISEIFTIRFGRHNVLVTQCRETAQVVFTHTNAEIKVICNTLLDPAAIGQAKEKTDIGKVRVGLGIEDGESFLLHVGALIKTKNVPALIKALADWQRKYRLVLVGSGSERTAIEKLVQNLGLARKVSLLGEKPHDETLSIIRACDVLILPSICEQMPNVVLEALALGRPVIATRVGGVPEIKSSNLYLVDRLDEVRDIVDSGIKAVEEAIIMQEYSLEKVAEQYEGLFLRLAGSKMKGKQV
jgi:glycosyltransferase involved in cell wall biosynthesis